MAEVNLGTLYEFNKNAMSSIPPLSKEELSNSINKIATEIKNAQSYKIYFMLLCNERKDYTVFKVDNGTVSTIGNDLKESLINRGEVTSIERLPDGAWEIWVRDVMTAENFVYYLFNYTDAIVIC